MPPFERDVNTVFQDYALFPHMTVGDNVGYGLMIKQGRPRHASRLGSRRRCAWSASKATSSASRASCRAASASASRSPERWSTGRACCCSTSHSGALDLRLREEMQIELKQIQQQVGITFIYVTHDQGEALTMSDRLAVFNHGRIEQIGTPADVYERPATQFVAGFVGTSNLLSGEVARAIVGHAGTFTVRPEKIRLVEPDDQPAADEVSALGHIGKVIYLGHETRYIVELDAGAQLVVAQQNLATSSSEALALEEKRVRLTWKRIHNLTLTHEGIHDKEES